MSELLKLAERCEQAAGPGGKLDQEIAVALGFTAENAAGQTVYTGYKRGCSSFSAPRFTSSTDIAQSLVPEGHDFATGSARKNSLTVKRPWAWVTPEDEIGSPVCEAATPALALCAAALRAKAATQ